MGDDAQAQLAIQNGVPEVFCRLYNGFGLALCEVTFFQSLHQTVH